MVPATPGRRMSPNVPTPGSGSFRFGCTERAERPSFSTRRRAKRRRQLRPRSSPSPLRGVRGKVAGQRLVDVSKLYHVLFERIPQGGDSRKALVSNPKFGFLFQGLLYFPLFARQVPHRPAARSVYQTPSTPNFFKKPHASLRGSGGGRGPQNK